jgi:hypothetical protein
VAGPLAVALVVVVAVVLAIRTNAPSDAQASLLGDQALTKTYQELDRQALLPSAQRSVDALAWAIPTPQWDTLGLAGAPTRSPAR